MKPPKLYIPSPTLSEASPETSNFLRILDSTTDALEYHFAKDICERYVDPAYRARFSVRNIEKVINPELDTKFQERKLELHDPKAQTYWRFHGTEEDSMSTIVKEGFSLSPKNTRPKSLLKFGAGIYFATDSSLSCQYARGLNRLLLCEVSLGRSLFVKEIHSSLDVAQLLQKYDSVFASRLHLRNDESVVYHPDQAIPRYVITFDMSYF
eukprot:TRINITY_DN763_c0_g1_i2.p2 TRINITY_DN763_c0_g1~~TRINITY_DN763_c0_g1_i2.p2  ORF type:complete len:210 (+),score=27.58 TRINITY_DN763_c0_g1_i2:823-1452(+)